VVRGIRTVCVEVQLKIVDLCGEGLKRPAEDGDRVDSGAKEGDQDGLPRGEAFELGRGKGAKTLVVEADEGAGGREEGRKVAIHREEVGRRGGGLGDARPGRKERGGSLRSHRGQAGKETRSLSRRAGGVGGGIVHYAT
jgi:hypothetical protein